MTPRNERRLARARLLKALPAAIRAAEADNTPPRILSQTLRSQAPYFKPENMEFVEIRRGELGGWVADLKLKQVPAGVPNGFGTPVRYPLPTREAAEASVVDLLAMALALHRHVAGEAAHTPPERVFDYFGFDIPHFEEMLTWMEAQCREHPRLRYGSAERARERLDEVTEQLFPGGKVTEEGLRALDRNSLAQLHAVLAMASIEGVFRYPEWPAYAPGQAPPMEAGPPSG